MKKFEDCFRAMQDMLRSYSMLAMHVDQLRPLIHAWSITDEEIVMAAVGDAVPENIEPKLVEAAAKRNLIAGVLMVDSFVMVEGATHSTEALVAILEHPAGTRLMTRPYTRDADGQRVLDRTVYVNTTTDSKDLAWFRRGLGLV